MGKIEMRSKVGYFMQLTALAYFWGSYARWLWQLSCNSFWTMFSLCCSLNLKV